MISPVIALDELIGSLDAATIKELRRQAPVALLDQFDAATTQMEQAARLAVQRGGGYSSNELRRNQIPDWIRLSVADTLYAFIKGTHDTCIHQPRYRQPQPVMAAAWKPGLITCIPCGHLFKVTAIADQICDRCGHFGGIHACTLTFGPLAFFYGLCAGCRTDQDEQRAAS